MFCLQQKSSKKRTAQKDIGSPLNVEKLAIRDKLANSETRNTGYCAGNGSMNKKKLRAVECIVIETHFSNNNGCTRSIFQRCWGNEVK